MEIRGHIRYALGLEVFYHICRKTKIVILQCDKIYATKRERNSLNFKSPNQVIAEYFSKPVDTVQGKYAILEY